MKLKQLTDENDLRAVKCKYADDPLFFLIWHSIEFELEKSFPKTKLSLYAYQSSDFILLFGYKKNQITIDSILLYRCGEFEAEAFNDSIAELFNLLSLPKGVLFIGEERLTKMVSEYYVKQSFLARAYPTKLFYMTHEQEDVVRNLPLPDLPDGYELGSADPDSDAEVITKTWIHSGQNEEEQTTAKLRCFPSSCVRYNGTPVGFEMVDHIGVLNHLFVFEAHRSRGLGNIIELDLARKMIRKGLKVSKCVELFNTAVLSGSARSPYWTTAVDANGEDVIFVFLVVTKK
ncbi:hypothetical protein V3C99_004113 [Haemonchus contortus]